MSGHFAISKPFPIFLAVTGALAAIAVAAPALVMIGFFVGILPGIVLFVAPSVFLYAFAWYLARTGILIAGTVARFNSGRWWFKVLAGVTAIPILIAAVFVPPHMINASVDRIVEEFQSDDRGTPQLISFPPIVAVLLPRGIDKQPACDTLCQRLLYNGAATKVVMGDSGSRSKPQPVAYWIERRDSCPKPVLASGDIVWPKDHLFRARRIPRTGVRGRAAAGECLIDGPGRIDDAGVQISYRHIKKGFSALENPWSMTLDTISANRLEVTKADGELLLRRTEVISEPLIMPLLIEMRAGFLT
ncbi:MAG TPA: hypothetical protein VGO84_18810, partial [Burkholderiales bacterium]|nr:hypothetical protein [Burkholderiales bacterium]